MAMTNRSKTLWMAVFILPVLTFACLVMWSNPPSHHTRINRASFQEISPGWTEETVEDFLSTRPGWFASKGMRPDGAVFGHALFSPGGVTHSDGSISKGWASDDGIILVFFDTHRKVKGKNFYGVVRIEEPSLVDKVIRFLRD
jgi:hypothetical protein